MRPSPKPIMTLPFDNLERLAAMKDFQKSNEQTVTSCLRVNQLTGEVFKIPLDDITFQATNWWATHFAYLVRIERTEKSRQKVLENMEFGIPKSVKGAPESRRKFLRERAEADRKRRNAMQGKKGTKG